MSSKLYSVNSVNNYVSRALARADATVRLDNITTKLPAIASYIDITPIDSIARSVVAKVSQLSHRPTSGDASTENWAGPPTRTGLFMSATPGRWMLVCPPPTRTVTTTVTHRY